MIKSERILAVGEPTRYRDKEEGGILCASGKGNVGGVQCGAAAPQGATSTRAPSQDSSRMLGEGSLSDVSGR